MRRTTSDTSRVAPFILHRAIHVALLVMLATLIVSYFTNEKFVLSVFQATGRAGDLLLAIPYVRMIVAVSGRFTVDAAYFGLAYLLMAGIFVNLAIAIYPAFSGAPDWREYVSLASFNRLLEREIYGKLEPSISMHRLFPAQEQLAIRPIVASGETYAEVLNKYKPSISGAYLLLAFFAFALFPYMLYDRLASGSAGVALHGYGILVPLTAYFQIRIVFEAFVMLIVIASQKASE